MKRVSEGVSYSRLFKLLLVGDSGVGKSSLLLRFTQNSFDEQQLSTIGVDFRVRHLCVDGVNVKLAVWDTAGQERFRTLTSSYYRGAQGCLLVYDVTNRESFEHLRMWLAEFDRYSNVPHAVKLIIANKIDKEKERQVSFTEGQAFARENQALLVETSAKTSENVVHAFEELVAKILDCPDLLVNTKPIGSPAVELSTANNMGNSSSCSC